MKIDEEVEKIESDTHKKLTHAFKSVNANLQRHFPLREKIKNRSSFEFKGDIAIVLWQFLRFNREFLNDASMGRRSKMFRENPRKALDASMTRLQERWQIRNLDIDSPEEAYPGQDFKMVRHRVKAYKNIEVLLRELELIKETSKGLSKKKNFQWIRVPIGTHPLEVLEALKISANVTTRTNPDKLLLQAFTLAFSGSNKAQINKAFDETGMSKWLSFGTFIKGRVEIKRQAKKTAQSFAELLAKTFP